MRMWRGFIGFSPLLPLLVFVSCGEQASSPPGASGGGSQGAGGTSGINVDGSSPNPCKQDGAPEQCKLVPSGPACGDGELNQASEQCDDGNSLPGDGCSGICIVEQHFECPTPGQPCISTIVCGDGVLGPGEACDDGNTQAGDGCSASCNLVEKGYLCRSAGQPCTRVFLCGDGFHDATEGCDDGDNDAGDGCDAKCRIEIGFKCSGSPSGCTPTTCGDRNIEGAESCDDGNTVPFDGCSGTCQAEPNCTGGACASSCGDGIVLGEACDDGNLRNGDGCSSTCSIESGHKCNNQAGTCVLVNGKCTMRVPVVYRDFNEAHSDFQPDTDSTGQKGLVEAALDSEGKPVFTGVGGGNIASTASFREWYRNSAQSAAIVGTLTLFQTASGSFVNRWGANGEQWRSYTNIRWCGNGGTNCGSCAAGSYTQCLYPCTPWNNNSECGVDLQYYDGNPVFFPIDNHPLALPDTRHAARVAPEYGGNWDPEPGSPLHNFHFTTEVHYWFEYTTGSSARLDFTGDDDVWVFVNKRLALDLGGWHPPLSGSVVIDGATAASFGLTSGRVYEIAVFHAERKTDGSSFRLTLSGFNLAPSECTTDCGDGKIAPGEECDDGVTANKGGYGECTPSCTLGPRCGDAIKQPQHGEVCDDGQNNGAYGGCAPGCQAGPRCGDAVVQPGPEQCDDGTNDGGYGECSPGCVRGPYCGDGVLTLGFEDCDDGNNANNDGCSSACKHEVIGPR